MSNADKLNDEWVLTSPNTLERPLRGPELIINNGEEQMEGNFQFVFGFHLTCNLTNDQVKSRLPTAWLRTRQSLPEVGVKLIKPDGSLDTAYFECLTTLEQAKQWTDSSLKFINDGTNVDEFTFDLTRKPMNTPGKQCIIYFVYNTRSGRSGMVLNSSHSINGHRGLITLNFLLQALALPDADVPLSQAFIPEQPNSLVQRLPQSLIRAYEQRFPATDADLEEASSIQEVVADRSEMASVGIPVKSNWRERPPKMHNLQFTVDWNESRRTLRSVKRLGISLTTALYSCIVSGIAQTYGKESDQGAHLNFSVHGKRWFKTDGEDGAPPVGLAIVPGGAWVDKKQVNLAPNNVEGLVQLAKVIAKEQVHDIRTPHIIGVFDSLAHGYVALLPELKNIEPTYSRPILTSQATVLFPKHSEIRRGAIGWSDFTYAGRNTDPTVVFAIHTVRGMLRTYMVFDERYFDVKEMEQLGLHVMTLFSRFQRHKPLASSRL